MVGLREGRRTTRTKKEEEGGEGKVNILLGVIIIIKNK